MRINYIPYNTHKYLISPFHSDENLGLQESSPLLFAPATGNFACDEAIPKDGWGDMDRVLTGKLDCILELISDCGTTVWSGFVGEEVSQDLLFVLAGDGQSKLNDLGPGLGRGATGRRDVVEILLTIHKGEMEFPELLGGNAGDS